MQNPRFKFEYFAKTIRYKDFNIATYVIGSGEKNVLSFPSFPHSGLYYLWFLNHYDLSKVKFYTLDLPGWIGYSDNIFKNKPFDIEEYINIIKTLIKDYDINKFSVLGYSYGGALTVRLVNDLPDMVEKVVLVSPVVNSRIIQHTKEVSAVNLAKKMGISKVFDWYLKDAWNKYKPQIITEGFPEGLIAVYENMIRHSNSQVLMNSLYTLFHSDLTGYLGCLKDKPLLTINSLNEGKMFRKQAEFLRRKFINCESTYLTGSHEDFILKPKSEVVKKVVHFLTS